MADMVKKVKVFLIKLYGKEGKMETRKKGSHLNIEERRQIAILDKEGWSPYKIAKKLKRASNTKNWKSSTVRPRKAELRCTGRDVDARKNSILAQHSCTM